MSCVTLKEVGGDLVVDVAQESTVIGRGQFLQITDKRVSRSHALLELKDGKLYITPTHTNPCFLRTEASKEQTVLARDVKHMLSNGDEFGLLPDQLFYKVCYPQLNGTESEKEKETKEEADLKPENVNDDTAKPDIVSNGGSQTTKDDTSKIVDNKDTGLEKAERKAASAEKEDTELKEDSSSREKTAAKLEIDDKKEKKKDEKEEKDEEEEPEDEDKEDMAMPVDKKRVLPAWMVKAANQESPTKEKTSPKKPISEAVNKRLPGTKISKPEPDEEDEDLEEEMEDEDVEEEYKPEKKGRGKSSKFSDDDYEEEASDDDYTPEKPSPRNQRGRGRKKKRTSDSEEDDFSDEDDDYSPRKAKAKKTPKGRGKKKTTGKKGPARTAKPTTPRNRAKRKLQDDDDDEFDEEIVPRRRGGPVDDDDETPSRRPQRAAKQKRGSYVDDPMIEEALEDFASEEEVVEDKDSDFDLEGIEDSGSDWERSTSNSQKQKVAKVKGRPAAKPVSRRGSAKKKGRRPSRPKDSDDDDNEDDDIMEDDEPYVPRPSKRRGGLLSEDMEESDEDGQKKRRRRETCQYGKKCYRKNPVHFRTFCHPGDSSYGEDEEEDSNAVDGKKDRDPGKASPSKPSRPQRSTAGTKLVTHGADDDDLPDTYDYQDSFIDDGTQPSEGEAEDDSDYDAEEDIRGLAKEAKAFVRGKKK